MAASEAIPEVLAVLLGDVYGKLSAINVTNGPTKAHIKNSEYQQGKIRKLVLASNSVKAGLLDMFQKSYGDLH